MHEFIVVLPRLLDALKVMAHVLKTFNLEPSDAKVESASRGILSGGDIAWCWTRSQFHLRVGLDLQEGETGIAWFSISQDDGDSLHVTYRYFDDTDCGWEMNDDGYPGRIAGNPTSPLNELSEKVLLGEIAQSLSDVQRSELLVGTRAYVTKNPQESMKKITAFFTALPADPPAEASPTP